jgi:hypothetical protein
MKTLMILDFKTETDHCRFVSWLAAWQSENKADLGARITFVRDQFGPLFSRWCLIENETVKNAAGAFNAFV